MYVTFVCQTFFRTLLSKVGGWDLVLWLMEDNLRWKTTFSGEATSKHGRRLGFGMLTVLMNIRSTEVLC